MKSPYLITLLILLAGCYQQERYPYEKFEPVVYEEPTPPEVVGDDSYKYCFIVMETLAPDDTRQRFTTDVVETDVHITPEYEARELDIAEKSLRDAEFEHKEVIFTLREFSSFNTYQEASHARQLAINR